jgi:hypothetical protein
VRNLKDFDGNNLPDDDWTLGLFECCAPISLARPLG